MMIVLGLIVGTYVVHNLISKTLAAMMMSYMVLFIIVGGAWMLELMFYGNVKGLHHLSLQEISNIIIVGAVLFGYGWKNDVAAAKYLPWVVSFGCGGYALGVCLMFFGSAFTQNNSILDAIPKVLFVACLIIGHIAGKREDGEHAYEIMPYNEIFGE